jgi:GNAT superfamily N-acetyltransferase
MNHTPENPSSDPMIVRLIDKSQMLSIVPLLRKRNPQLSEQVLSERVVEMVSQNFQCSGCYLGDRLIAIAGFWIKTRYHTGKLIEPDNVFVEEEFRSQGIGEKLMAWVYNYGRELGCTSTELHCYTTNSRAHRFWFNQGYDIIAFHFSKNL